MLYKEIPFVRFTLPFVVGILLRYLNTFWSTRHIIVLILLSIIPLLIKSDERKRNAFFGLIVFVFFLAAGYSIYSIRYSIISGLDYRPGNFTVRIEKYPVPRERSVKVPSTIMIKNGRDRYKKGGRIMLYFPPESSISDLSPGSLIELNLNPREITDFDTIDNFDYREYMLHSGYKYSGFADSYEYKRENIEGLIHKSGIIQNSLYKKYSISILDERSLAIISALTLGYKEELDEEIRDKFSGAGISHIMAVSGLHVGIIMIMVSGMLDLSRVRSRFVRFIIILLAVWSFALISGMSHSVSRASLMFTFLATGKYIERQVNPINSLFASAFILLLIDPFILFSVSFQLSYSAVLAILLFYRKVDGLVNFSGILLRKTWSLVSVTILAQAGTLPFTLYHFRSFQIFSAITNIFAIPLTFIIILTGLVFLSTPQSLFLNEFLSKLIIIETRLLYSIADWISSIS